MLCGYQRGISDAFIPTGSVLGCRRTLVDSRVELYHYHRVLREHGRSLPKEIILFANFSAWGELAPEGVLPGPSRTLETFQSIWYNVYLSCVQRCGFNEGLKLNAVVSEFEPFEFSSDQHLQLFPDSLQALSELADNYRLVVVSNWSWHLSDFLTIRGIRDYFELIVISAQVGFNKAYPGIFEHALALANVTPEQVVMVGDSYESDVLGAQEVGILGVLLDR